MEAPSHVEALGSPPPAWPRPWRPLYLLPQGPGTAVSSVSRASLWSRLGSDTPESPAPDMMKVLISQGYTCDMLAKFTRK